MIVDDDPTIIRIIKKMLEKFGYNSSIFDSPEKALEQYKKDPNKFDLIISDLIMPEMTGTKLADQLHTINPMTPVIIMTGYKDKIDLNTISQKNIKEVIHKPISVDTLMDAIRKIFDT